MIQRTIVGCLLLLACAGTILVAQTGKKQPTLLTYSLEQEELHLAPGRSATVAVTMNIASGWWSYGMKSIMDKDGIGPAPTEIRLLASDVVSQAGAIQAPKPKTKYDVNFSLDIEYYEHTAKFLVPLRVGKNVRPGRYKAAIQVYAMVCDSNQCFPPRADTLYCDIVVEPASKSGKRKKDDIKGDNSGYGKPDPTNMIQDTGSIPGRADNGEAGAVEYRILFDNRKILM